MLETPITLPPNAEFRVSFHVHNTAPYKNLSMKRYTGRNVCGRSVDSIKKENVDSYMRRSTTSDEPEYVTRLRKEAFHNDHAVIFVPPSSSVADCGLWWNSKFHNGSGTRECSGDAPYLLKLDFCYVDIN